MTPRNFVSFNLESLAEITEQRGGGAGISGEESRRRRGESGGKWRGARELPLGGRGSSGESLRRQVRSEGWPAVGLIAGGHAPVREGGSGWVRELQEGDGVPFQGLIRGVGGRSRELHDELELAGVRNGGGVLSARAGGALPLL